MYVPAERNFLSAVDYPDKLKGLPKSLSTFWEEMQRSLQELSGSLVLPVGNVKLEYNKSNKITRIVGKNYSLRLSEASSGFQSYVPLFLVSKNLAQSLGREKDNSKSEMSTAEQRRLKDEIEKIVTNPRLSEEFKEAALKLLSDKFKNDSFLNIVEEIEQNLFPSSQKQILFKLIEFANEAEGNSLVLTTHSPYIINYFTLCIKAYDVYLKIQQSKQEELEERLNEVVPLKSIVDSAGSIVYELNEDGSIKILETYKGLPSDDNYLNEIFRRG
ncbi:AAA family ATPase [Pedobacter sp. UBA4863]|uniref:AAA family ATPase n=1 Tax=Pedobacter sp. UBA4863 TaxID=1947060 RepID=UPI0025FEB2FA|nr:AAA family ATPase [Pedobacter sp. UBA4863]